MNIKHFVAGAALLAGTSLAAAGEIKGHATAHTPESIAAGVENAQVALPAQDGAPFVGLWKDAPTPDATFPTVVFLHGSSGINPKLGYDKYQAWLAENGVASVMFDGMRLPERLRYKSPVDKETYEKVHALRASEIPPVLEALEDAGWADMGRLVLAGTSEGSVTVARTGGDAFAARIIYSWACEDNYYVAAHDTAVEPGQPVLNIISDKDKYFSSKNDFVSLDDPTGHCGPALAENEAAEVLLVPGAPHTLINLPPARDATLGFLTRTVLN